ncbi:conserved hypothetical protein [Sodalis glossinidius str. 'morsitans']|uniref:Allantoinase n=1 Tax=Sodalis glossinidius (strain morsitans) TaxID=343509 RepID=Q2NVF7_SODGM|nr:conserved hypothetical protein [Sodalis glossinidius str. 'morsitans']
MSDATENKSFDFNANYPRDLIGYAGKPPHAGWPQQARIAVQFVLNYEEGVESHVLHGDAGFEKFLSDIIGAASYPERHMSMDSLYEYGSRAGFWRIHQEFRRRGLPLTVFGVALAALSGRRCQNRTPAYAAGGEWLTQLFGSAPLGWYTGHDSPNTRRLVVEQDGFLYDSDYYGDDLPFWAQVTRQDGTVKPHLIIPYTLDANDMGFTTP